MDAKRPRSIDGHVLLSIGILDQMLDEARRAETLPEAHSFVETAKQQMLAVIEGMHSDFSSGEDDFRLLADNAPVIIWRSGTDKLCDWFNKPWLDFTGRTLQQELGYGWTEGVHADDLERCVSTYVSAFDRRENFCMEYRLRRHDGVYRWIIDNGQPFFSRAGEFRGYFGSGIDIDDRKRAEAEMELIARLMRVSVLGELSGAIAHEINQPLTAILSNADEAQEMLAGGSPHLGEVEKILRDIGQEATRAGEVIRRLRRLMTRGERRSDPIDVNALVRSTLAMLRSELLDRRIRVEVAQADRLPVTIGDPVQLQQVLVNLMMNAMEAMNAMPHARRRIEVASRPTATNLIEVEIADHGPGIAPDARGRLFQPFFTTKEHGLGLGLTISSQIVSSHGGKLNISNIPGGGAAAVVSLPAHHFERAAQ
jgi:PAS domain S-box-containing protein